MKWNEYFASHIEAIFNLLMLLFMRMFTCLYAYLKQKKLDRM